MNNLKELYNNYVANKNNEPISDPEALEEIIKLYDNDLKIALKDKNKRMSEDRKLLLSKRIISLKSKLREYQNAYNYVVSELTK